MNYEELELKNVKSYTRKIVNDAFSVLEEYLDNGEQEKFEKANQILQNLIEKKGGCVIFSVIENSLSIIRFMENCSFLVISSPFGEEPMDLIIVFRQAPDQNWNLKKELETEMEKK